MKLLLISVGTLCAVTLTFIVLTMPNHAIAAEDLPAEVTVRLADSSGQPGPAETVPTVRKTPAEWQKILDPNAFAILRGEGTEPPFTGALLKNNGTGIYVCAGCELPLFASATKFDSGTGWPSFYAPFAPENISEDRDVSYGMVRTEVHCPRCGGHQGHVFPDGPAPTGLRYCINAASLKFQPIE